MSLAPQFGLLDCDHEHSLVRDAHTSSGHGTPFCSYSRCWEICHWFHWEKFQPELSLPERQLCQEWGVECQMLSMAQMPPSVLQFQTAELGVIVKHWITELQIQLSWKRTLRSSCPTCEWTPPCQPDHSTECHFQSFFKYLWVTPSCPTSFGQSIPMFNHPSCEEILPNVQAKLP